MDEHAYQAFTDRLCANADADPHVLGVVALGSMADAARRDRWSDHDFFWIVESGLQEGYRRDLSWLPDAGAVVMALRETAHGLKVLFADGHLIEFAVFDPDEIALARVNDAVILRDHADIAARIDAVRARSGNGAFDPLHGVQTILGVLQVGVGRYARGERVTASRFIKGFAFEQLIPLLSAVVPPSQPEALDNLDPFRRFERRYPALGAEIDRLLSADGVTCAAGWLDILEREIAPRMVDFPTAALAAVRGVITVAVSL